MDGTRPKPETERVNCRRNSRNRCRNRSLDQKIAFDRGGLACRRQFFSKKSKERTKILRFITKKGNLGGLDQGGRSESCGILRYPRYPVEPCAIRETFDDVVPCRALGPSVLHRRGSLKRRVLRLSHPLRSLPPAPLRRRL